MSPNGERSERCATCRYWASAASECHRHAPSLVVALAVERATGAWPVTAAHEWCGEWVPASDQPRTPEPAGADDSVPVRVFLARLAPSLNAHNPRPLLESLLEQLPSDVRQVLVRTNGLDGRPPAGIKEVAREFKMSQGHVRALLASGETLLTEVVRLLTHQRTRT